MNDFFNHMKVDAKGICVYIYSSHVIDVSHVIRIVDLVPFTPKNHNIY